MASSVSSERAFSAAGIAISKRRNRLKADIIEALQCLKCMYNNDLIFRPVTVLEAEEGELDGDDGLLPLLISNGGALGDADNKFTWDQLLTMILLMQMSCSTLLNGIDILSCPSR